MSIEILPEVLQQLVQSIDDLIDSYFPNRLRTLPVKINNRKQNITVTWNIYPTEKITLKDLFQIFVKTIDENLIDINGEIIQYKLINGKILDNPELIQEFEISTGKSWEIYLYEPETFIYLRLLYESRIANPHDKWISIDIDIVKESAWFAT